MIPDFVKAEDKAKEIISKYGTNDPMSILKSSPYVLLLSFQEMSSLAKMDRQEILDLFGDDNHDAVSTVFVSPPGNDELRYIVAYNKTMTPDAIRNALARELGHIVLHHDGTRPEAVRNDEAMCFADHLLRG